MIRHRVAAVAVAVVAAIAAHSSSSRAERPGGPEIGLQLGVHAISGNTELARDDSLSASSTPGTGIPLLLRFGIPLGEMFRVELEGSALYSSTGDRMGDGAVFGWRGLVRARFGGLSRRARPFVLAGGGGQSAIIGRSLETTKDTIFAGTVGGGLELGLTTGSSLRIDARTHISPGADGLAADVEVLIGVCFGRACGYLAPAEQLEPIMSAKPARDSDEDGIFGESDACPLRPEDVDGFEDEDGCPDEDNDGDGVPDTGDQCADGAETRNGFDDGDGCPDELPDDLAAYDGIVAGIVFRPGTAIFDQRSFVVLDKLAAALDAHPNVKIKVISHTHAAGKPEELTALSEQRAAAIRQYLIDKGIAEERVEAAGVGPDSPLTGNDTPEGRGINERIEIRLQVE